MNISPVFIFAPAFLPVSARPAAGIRPSSGDRLEISDEARARIDALEAGTATLEQAIRAARQQTRLAAREKIGQAREYLKLLRAMSSPDDPAIAREAARMALEIRNAAGSFQDSLNGEDRSAMANETAALIGEAGKGLALAKGMVERYLRSKKLPSHEDLTLRDAVDNAIAGVGEAANGEMAGILQITLGETRP